MPPKKKAVTPKIVIPKKWNMPIRPGDKPGKPQTMPIRPGDKPGVWTNMSSRTNRRTAR